MEQEMETTYGYGSKTLSSERNSVKTLDQIREQLDKMREDAKAQYERAEAERNRLAFVHEPRPFDEVQHEKEKDILDKVRCETRFTDNEKERIKLYNQEMTSWNPMQRAQARCGRDTIFVAREQREKDAFQKMITAFREDELPQMKAVHEKSQRRYDAYEVMSYLWEDKMRDVEDVFNRVIPAIEEQLVVMESIGIKMINGIGRDADLAAIERVVSSYYENIPKAAREAMKAEPIREVIRERAWGRE